MLMSSPVSKIKDYDAKATTVTSEGGRGN